MYGGRVTYRYGTNTSIKESVPNIGLVGPGDGGLATVLSTVSGV